MGYISRDIAIITEPRRLSLSNVPNFVTFESKPAAKTYLEFNLQINISSSTPGDIPTLSRIDIMDSSDELHSFNGSVGDDVGGTVFHVSSDQSTTAENIRQALLYDKFIASNFDVVIPFNWDSGSPQNGRVINIKSKGAGSDYNIQVNTSNQAYALTWINRISLNNDSISGEETTKEIEVDVYVNPAVFLGQDDRPITPALLGSYATSLLKTYTGAPLWFELNELFAQYGLYNIPGRIPGWFNTGTVQSYRFVAKVRGVDSFNFYQSNALYTLLGHGPIHEALDLESYVYTDNTVKLLTNKPATPYIRGQREYLNFLLSYSTEYFNLRIAYEAYSTGGHYMGIVYGQEINRSALSIVNTCVLDIDTLLDQYPAAAIVRVALARGTSIVSNRLEYYVRPECLHALRQFSFINRLGGWDAFNFDAGLEDEIKKPNIETYEKTVTPSYRIGDSVETVYSSTIQNTYTVEGAPVTDKVAEWLKELVAARTVLDQEGNYIIIEDFTLDISPENRNMQRPTIKYRLSK